MGGGVGGERSVKPMARISMPRELANLTKGEDWFVRKLECGGCSRVSICSEGLDGTMSSSASNGPHRGADYLMCFGRSHCGQTLMDQHSRVYWLASKALNGERVE